MEFRIISNFRLLLPRQFLCCQPSAWGKCCSWLSVQCDRTPAKAFLWQSVRPYSRTLNLLSRLRFRWMLSLDPKVNTLNICTFPRSISLRALYDNPIISKMSKDVKGTFNSPHLRFWKKQCPESLVIILVRQTCTSEATSDGKDRKIVSSFAWIDSLNFYGFPILLHLSPWFQPQSAG